MKSRLDCLQNVKVLNNNTIFQEKQTVNLILSLWQHHFLFRMMWHWKLSILYFNSVNTNNEWVEIKGYIKRPFTHIDFQPALSSSSLFFFFLNHSRLCPQVQRTSQCEGLRPVMNSHSLCCHSLKPGEWFIHRAEVWKVFPSFFETLSPLFSFQLSFLSYVGQAFFPGCQLIFTMIIWELIGFSGCNLSVSWLQPRYTQPVTR